MTHPAVQRKAVRELKRAIRTAPTRKAAFYTVIDNFRREHPRTSISRSSLYAWADKFKVKLE